MKNRLMSKASQPWILMVIIEMISFNLQIVMIPAYRGRYSYPGNVILEKSIPPVESITCLRGHPYFSATPRPGMTFRGVGKVEGNILNMTFKYNTPGGVFSDSVTLEREK